MSSELVGQNLTPEEVEDIRQIAEYLYHFYEIWNVCELREYTYEEIKQQAVDEFLRRRYCRATEGVGHNTTHRPV